jgi:DnaK suppressor protein
MDAKQLVFFRAALLKERERILNQVRNAKQQDLQLSTDDLPDESDLAAFEVHQNLVFQMRDRERQLLQQIDRALERIESGSYGVCEETEEPIEVARLKVMPWTPLSAAGAEMREERRKRFAG